MTRPNLGRSLAPPRMIRMSAEERAAADAKANVAGVSFSELARAAIAAYDPPVPDVVDEPDAETAQDVEPRKSRPRVNVMG